MLDLAWQYRGFLQYFAIFALAAVCWWRGARPERLCALVMVSLVVVDVLYHAVAGRGTYSHVDLPHLAIDGMALAAFFAIMLRANRIYPIWLFAAQLVSTSMHLQRFVSPDTNPTAYAILNIAPSYLQLSILAIGLVAHIRREKRHGPYRSWRESSPRSSANAKRS